MAPDPALQNTRGDTDRDTERAILIVDDSAVARAAIGSALAGRRGYVVAAAVADPRSALAFLATAKVDAIVLDLEMPGGDGLAALPALRAAANGAPILVVSSSCTAESTTTAQALAAGATATLAKPRVGDLAGRFRRDLAERLDRMCTEPTPGPARPTPRQAAARIELIAIGASTGGIHALSRLLPRLSGAVRQPILITQHLPGSFMSYFAAQVALMSQRPCTVATESSRLVPGHILIAPGDAHVRVVRTTDGAAIRLSRESAPSGCCPSVDPMLDSIADTFGNRALAIMLSGMGRDGIIGARRLTAAGGTVFAQDQASSVVWGMPGAVANAGIAEAVLPPEEIGRLVDQACRSC